MLAGLLLAASRPIRANPIIGLPELPPLLVPGIPAARPIIAPTVPAQAITPAPATAAAPAVAPPGQAATAGGLPPYQRFAVAPQSHDGRPIICIVIDDLGVMHRGTERSVALPAPLTLSWFPFAKNLEQQVSEAMARGHETTLHMPMQAFSNSTYQTGPDPLRIDLPPEVNLARLRAAMDAVPSTVGLNNHMGSVATKNVPLMELVAAEAKARGMLFLDSLTIGGSVGWREAQAAGIPADARDIFIDNSSQPAMIQQALLDIEQHARRHGNVIAIGHPRPHTMDALEAWMPTLPGKGFILWPLAATMALRAQEKAATQHA